MTSLMTSDCPSHQVELEVPLMTSLMTSDCPSHQVELEVPPDMRIRSVHKAETLVRLSWLAPPSTFLLLKKPGSSDITQVIALDGPR
jgi:hypothetical protein